LSSNLLSWQNITVIVANDVPPQLFNKNKLYGKKVFVWKIKDVEDNSLKSMIKISKEIEKEVKNLLRRLND
ncbi:MAG: hypothetical protein AABY22_26230, partial [Nanoarchaeota archaeon]